MRKFAALLACIAVVAVLIVEKAALWSVGKVV